MAVRAKLTPIPAPSPSPGASGTYGTLEIGGKRFQVFHYRGNQQIAHSDAEWRQIATEVETLLDGALQDPTDVSELYISKKAVKYISHSQSGKASMRPLPLHVDQLVLRRLNNHLVTTGQTVASYDRNSVYASYDQNRSPYGDGLGVNACTAIDLQFAEMALLGATSNAPIDRDLIEEAVMRGQMKIKQRRLERMHALGWQLTMEGRLRAYEQADRADKARIEENFAFDDQYINLPAYHPSLCQAPDLNPNANNDPYPIRNATIPEQNTAEFYEQQFTRILNPEISGVPGTVPVVFAGFTVGVISFGVLVHRDVQNPRRVSKVVYFDSHGHPSNKHVACAKTFDSENAARDAARFLSQRMPYKRPGERQAGQAPPANPNALQITPFYLHEFFYAQTDAERTRLYDQFPPEHSLANAIAAACVDPQQGENRQARAARAGQLLLEPQNKAALLRNATPERVLALLRNRDRDYWPYPGAS